MPVLSLCALGSVSNLSYYAQYNTGGVSGKLALAMERHQQETGGRETKKERSQGISLLSLWPGKLFMSPSFLVPVSTERPNWVPVSFAVTLIPEHQVIAPLSLSHAWGNGCCCSCLASLIIPNITLSSTQDW